MNLKTKTNTVKQILSKVMVVVLLAVSVLTLSSCSYVRFSGGTFTSHKEFEQFLIHFNSVNDGEVSTFISFDFDKNNQIQNKQYEYHIEVLDRPLIKEDINDKFAKQVLVKMFFYLNDNETCEYQIMCVYSAKGLNFYQDDDYKLIPAEDGKEDIVYKQNSGDLTDKYISVQKYVLCIDHSELMEIYISSTAEFTQEKLDQICEILMDNIVIINTEG